MVTWLTPAGSVLGKPRLMRRSYLNETPPAIPTNWPGHRRYRGANFVVDEFPTIDDDPTEPEIPPPPPPPPPPDPDPVPGSRTWKSQLGLTAPGAGSLGSDWVWANEMRNTTGFYGVSVSGWDFRTLKNAGYIDWTGHWLKQPPAGTTYVQSGRMVDVTGPTWVAGLRQYVSGKRFRITWTAATGSNPNINDDAISIVDGNGTIVNLGQRALGYIVHPTGHNYFRLRFTLGGSRDITKFEQWKVTVRECDENWIPVDTHAVKNDLRDTLKDYDVLRHMDQLGGSQPGARSHLELCDMNTPYRSKGAIDKYDGLSGKPYREIFAVDYSCGLKGSWINVPALLGAGHRYYQISKSKSPTVTYVVDASGRHIVPGSFEYVGYLGTGTFASDTGVSPVVTGSGAGTLDVTPDGILSYNSNAPHATVNNYFEAFQYRYTDVLAGVQTRTFAVQQYLDKSGAPSGTSPLCEPTVTGMYDGAAIFGSPHIRAWCEYVLDELSASGVPITYTVYIEVSNEKWNGGNVAFGFNKRHFSGLGSYLGRADSEARGGGWMLARIIHEMKLAQTARGSNWKFFWVVAGQLVGPGTVQGQYEAIAQYFSQNGLTMSDYFGPGKGGTFITTYIEGLFGDKGVYPIPNGSDAGATRYNAIEAAILNDEEAFWQECYDFLTNESHGFREQRTFGGVLNSWAAHHAVAQTFGARVEGAYEGDWHITVGGFSSRPVIMDSYIKYLGGAWGANLRRKLNLRIIELYPWAMLSNYARRGWWPNGGPWLQGFLYDPMVEYDNLWKEFGPNP